MIGELYTDATPLSTGYYLKFGKDSLECAEKYDIRMTVNVAEYMAILKGLQCALDKGVTHLALYSDSELAVRQLLGRYRVKDKDLQYYHALVKELLKKFELYSIAHIAGINNPADRISREVVYGPHNKIPRPLRRQGFVK
jgi:ribonuclease HI